MWPGTTPGHENNQQFETGQSAPSKLNPKSMQIFCIDTTAAHSELIVIQQYTPRISTEINTADFIEWVSQGSMETGSPVHHDDCTKMVSLVCFDHRCSILNYQQYIEYLPDHELKDLVVRYLQSQEQINWLFEGVAA